jgi:hypothetical protein
MKKTNILIDNQTIEMLTEYKYLGIKLNETLSWKPLYEAKLKTLKWLKASIAPLMYKLPLPGRMLVVKNIILPKITFGAKVIPPMRIYLKKMQIQLNIFMRTALGTSMMSLSLVSLRQEFNLKTLELTWKTAMARLTSKAPGLKTTLPLLLASPSPATNTWTYAAAATEKSTRAEYDRVLRRADTAAEDLPSLVEMIRALWIEAEKLKSNKTTIFRDQNHLGPIKEFWWNMLFRNSQEHWKGLQGLVRMRLGIFLTAQKLAQIRVGPSQWLEACPFCDERIPETLEHFLRVCPKWRIHRSRAQATCDISFLIGGKVGHKGNLLPSRSSKLRLQQHDAATKVAKFLTDTASVRATLLAQFINS